MTERVPNKNLFSLEKALFSLPIVFSMIPADFFAVLSLSFMDLHHSTFIR